MSSARDPDELPALAVALAEFMRSHARAEPELAAASAALLARERVAGHSCIELTAHAGDTVLGTRMPEPARWARALAASGVAGGADAVTPLALIDGRLYLRRYWSAEKRLASGIRARLAQPADEDDAAVLAPLMTRLFPSGGEVDWQAVAAAAALRGRFTVIAGGPGTGKTTTVARLLALLATRQPGLRIALAAPTGKAATRLAESVAAQARRLDLPAETLAALTVEATTLHRLLDYEPRHDRFRRRPGRPLAADVVVVDEASMADLLLMDALLAALPPRARLVLLGDPGQLASVEAGHVLGDLVRAAAGGHGPDLGRWCTALGLIPPPAKPAPGPLADAVVELRANYRFASQPGIGALAQALRAGDGDGAIAAATAHADVALVAHPTRPAAAVDPLIDACAACVGAPDAATALARFAELRVLTPLRSGPWGVSGLNAAIEARLRARGAIGPGALHQGRPILITANDWRLGLANGDVGVIWDEAAWFPGADGLRRIAIPRLPPHATAWAMTVHKAQGSEFARVLVVVPPGDAPFLTRELLYTAITRAKRRVELVATPAQLSAAAQRSAARASGLAAALTVG